MPASASPRAAPWAPRRGRSPPAAPCRPPSPCLFLQDALSSDDRALLPRSRGSHLWSSDVASRRRPARSIESAIRAAAQLGQLPSWDQSCGVDDDFLSDRPRPKTRNQPTPLVDAVSPLSPCIHHGSGALIRTMSVRGGIASGVLVLSNCA